MMERRPTNIKYYVVNGFDAKLKEQLWHHVAEAHSGTGLVTGTPHFGPAAKVYKKLCSEGCLAEARAVNILIYNRAWCGE